MNFIRNFKELIIEYLPYLYAAHNLVIKSKIFLPRKSYAHTEEDLFILKEFLIIFLFSAHTLEKLTICFSIFHFI